eukprot:TRINITY_DN13065_c0_g1_i1.p1 TRINITY_DN13065_c0_g1~~TRINITY_DN13065_c0_g1_i1.p1  ORF type:complete len:272 (-),score=30.11 TRINITY_DN13065_c0_g1_i1:42-857(-)
MHLKLTGVVHDFFSKVVSAVDIKSKTETIIISPTTVQFIQRGETDEQPQVWGRISMALLCSKSQVTSSNEDIIGLEVKREALISGVNRTGKVTNASLKLVSLQGQGHLLYTTVIDHQDRDVVQYIKVNVMVPSDIEKFKMPLLGDPDVLISSPGLNRLRTVFDNLMALSDDFIIKVNSDEQQFVVRAAEVTASVEVKYQNIRCTKKEDSDESLFEATVNGKDLSAFLSLRHLLQQNQTVNLSIYKQKTVVVFSELDSNSTVLFYFPVKMML